jgi:exodeoxyribonuclease V gamma subunit
MRAPLHFYPGSSWAYAESLLIKGNAEVAENAALSKWQGNDYFPGERDRPYHRLLLPGDTLLDDDFRATSLVVFKPLIEHLESV